jgi:hypothetical protein
MSELIADCARIPNSVTTARPAPPEPGAGAAWSVDERCRQQVEGLNDYGS